MKTILLATLLLCATSLCAQQRLTVEEIREAVPGASPSFVFQQYDAGATSKEQVRLAWQLDQQKPGFDWSVLSTQLATILTIVLAHVYNRYFPPVVKATPEPGPLPATPAAQPLMSGTDLRQLQLDAAKWRSQQNRQTTLAPAREVPPPIVVPKEPS
jgi:hypothetical protein